MSVEVRIIVLLFCVVVQGLYYFSVKNFGVLDRALITWFAAYSTYYALKELFGF